MTKSRQRKKEQRPDLEAILQEIPGKGVHFCVPGIFRDDLAAAGEDWLLVFDFESRVMQSEAKLAAIADLPPGSIIGFFFKGPEMEIKLWKVVANDEKEAGVITFAPVTVHGIRRCDTQFANTSAADDRVTVPVEHLIEFMEGREDILTYASMYMHRDEYINRQNLLSTVLWLPQPVT